jgi:hypothetical protein
MGTDNVIFLEVIEWFDETGQELVHRILYLSTFLLRTRAMIWSSRTYVLVSTKGLWSMVAIYKGLYSRLLKLPAVPTSRDGECAICCS